MNVTEMQKMETGFPKNLAPATPHRGRSYEDKK